MVHRHGMWFADVAVAVADAECGEDLFADDLTCERTFGHESDVEIMSEMQSQ